VARFVKGEVVVVPFPFSDLTQAKRRPALILAELRGEDRILCQITSREVRDEDALTLVDADFDTGTLRQVSSIRPNRLFTADQSLILYAVGRLNTKKTTEVIERVIAILKR
jgi:mRNA interferase MazF